MCCWIRLINSQHLICCKTKINITDASQVNTLNIQPKNINLKIYKDSIKTKANGGSLCAAPPCALVVWRRPWSTCERRPGCRHPLHVAVFGCSVSMPLLPVTPCLIACRAAMFPASTEPSHASANRLAVDVSVQSGPLIGGSFICSAAPTVCFFCWVMFAELKLNSAKFQDLLLLVVLVLCWCFVLLQSENLWGGKWNIFNCVCVCWLWCMFAQTHNSSSYFILNKQTSPHPTTWIYLLVKLL